ncbi:hypothetical protein DLAC_02686 [Tieghemostelium lacteum]|uniref:Major facilitator superfamily (MFS) profile domain-containing protein n=1 Tax=Tieghemostelium lacteum TaxID=361077 RepID=A0A152A357_TIELA|nr:hypothetical protein DLAC_02686 [Tieghemostelium lacteum]|eukprot:KYR00656.1 hypothetical protein DLAC_02686 [Tieghemostelium lacteum]
MVEKNYANIDGEYELPKYYFPRRFLMIIFGFWAIVICYILRVMISITVLPMKSEYNWTDSYKGILLSGFFMGYVVTQIPAHFLCERFGGKRVLLVGLTISNICSILVPVGSNHAGVALIILRIFTGISQGITFPTINWMIKRWFPTSQRSTSASIIWSGIYIGTIVIDTSAPAIMNQVGWVFNYYIFGGIGMAWSIGWAIFIKDNPQDAWGIHPNEVALIKSDDDSLHASLIKNQKSANGASGGSYDSTSINVSPLSSSSSSVISSVSTGSSNSQVGGDLPYLVVCKALFSQSGIYVLLLYNLFSAFGFYFLLMWLPTWMETELGTSKGGMFSFFIVLPYVLSFATSNIAGYLSDVFLAKGVRKIVLRKIFGGLAAIIPGVLLLIICFVPMAKGLKVALMTINIAANGFSASGSNILTLDLSPTYAAITMGISNFVGTIPGILSNLIGGMLIERFAGSFVPIFTISASLYLGATFIWVIFAKTDTVV